MQLILLIACTNYLLKIELNFANMPLFIDLKENKRSQNTGNASTYKH
ncbi:hypothetical protein [Brunnivagina elsteri]|nr:hypothetical protein [Calothrix elsteri]